MAVEELPSFEMEERIPVPMILPEIEIKKVFLDPVAPEEMMVAGLSNLEELVETVAVL